MILKWPKKAAEDALMHIRVNIPRWGWAEHFNSVKALLSIGSERFIEELLHEIQAYCGTKNVYLVSSARYGLVLAIRHLNLAGKRIAVPGYVCPDILPSFECVGAKPVAIDVCPDSIGFDIKKLAQAVKRNEIDGILAPNSYGLDQDIEALYQFGIPIIEDAAYQAGLLSNNNTQFCGLRADVGVWSFNFKALTSIGGGVLFTSNELTPPLSYDIKKPNLKEFKLYLNRVLRSILKSHIPTVLPGAMAPQHDQTKELNNNNQGINQRPISTLQAGIALAQWKKRKNIYDYQLRNVNLLKDIISQCVAVRILSPIRDELTPHILPVILCVRRGKAQAAQYRFRQILYSYSIQTKPTYPVVLGSPEKLPNSYAIADKIILIPCNVSLSTQAVTRIGKAIQNASKIIAQEYVDYIK